MKKLTLIPLALMVGALAIGFASNHKVSKEAHATDMTTYIEMSSSAFTDWTDDAGTFEGVEAKFWDDEHYFNALDTFFCGERKETLTGSLTLKSWTQYSQYIYFTWGGAQDLDDNVYLEFHFGEYTATQLNNTFSENRMLLRYFKIPDDKYALLDHDNGFTMYIKLVDNRTKDYGFHNFGYLHVNQTEEQVGDAMRYYLNNIKLSNANNPKGVYGHYLANADLRAVFLKAASNIDENFESKSSFVNHWYLDVNYDNFAELDRHADQALSVADYRSGVDFSTMPFNKTGSSFFRGWRESGEGYVASDTPKYRFMSRPFVLSGTGLVSIKMAGRSASLHVIDTETQTDLAWADLRSFNLTGDEKSQYLGFNTVTMVRHYINLSPYLGKTIQLALADVYDEQWASSYFDELITNYNSYPTFGIDLTSQQCGEGLQDVAHMYYFDQYIASTHIDNDPNGLKYSKSKEEVTTVDESPIYEAYKFLNHYYFSLRSPANEFNIGNASVETKRQIVKEYLALSADAKTIVDGSKDLQYNYEFTNEWYRKAVSTGNNVSVTMSPLVEEYRQFNVTFASNGGTGSMLDVEIKGDYTLPACGFTAPSGQEFAGWKVGTDDTVRQPGYVINVTADVVITAQWQDAQPVKFVITFNANGGTGSMSNMEVTEGQQLELPACTFTAPSGKQFDCWVIRNTRYAVGEKVDIISNTEVFAWWKNIPVTTYVVSFSANGGTGTMDALPVNENQSYTLPACGFTAPEGKEFAGWKVNGEGDLLLEGAVITITADTSLVAIWQDVTPVNPDPVTPDPVNPDPVDPQPQPQPEVDPEPEVEPTPEKKGCKSSITAASIIISLLSLTGAGLLVFKKKEK